MQTPFTAPSTKPQSASGSPHARGEDQQCKHESETALHRFVSLMRAPAVYIRMLLTTVAFCLMCYLHYGSIATTIYYGLICVVLLQVGYFGGVLYLVWQERSER